MDLIQLKREANALRFQLRQFGAQMQADEVIKLETQLRELEKKIALFSQPL